jgi:predicted component of type VI protein secretion system
MFFPMTVLRQREHAMKPSSILPMRNSLADNVVEKLSPGLSHFDAPATVRVSASRPADGNEITLHFVNYNREEPADKKNRGSGIKDEKPIAAPPSQADLKLDPKLRAARVEFLTPESEQPRALEFEQAGAHLRFRVPGVFGLWRQSSSAIELMTSIVRLLMVSGAAMTVSLAADSDQPPFGIDRRIPWTTSRVVRFARASVALHRREDFHEGDMESADFPHP